MRKLSVSNLLKVSVNKYDDLLVLDCDDMSIFEKFSLLYNNVEKISKEAENEVAELKKKYADGSAEDIEELRSYVRVNIEYAKKVMSELNAVFGADFTSKVFRENYEINPDFVPSEIALTELIEEMIPIMEEAYGERIKRNKSKDSADKRGKHTKSKDELIAAYKEKNADE